MDNLSLIALQDIWNAIGGLLLVILAIEFLPDLMKRLTRWMRYSRKGKPDYRALADAYEGAEWPSRYFVDYWEKRVDWKPHVGGRNRPMSSPYLNIGEDGLRRTWNDEKSLLDPKAARIFAFGGSTMEGAGARDEATVPSALARKLSDMGHRVTVTNFGQPAYTATQSFIAFAEELARGNVPDLAIFLDGLNETIIAEQSGVAGTVFNADSRAEEFNLLQPWRRRELFRHALYAAVPRLMRRYRDIAEVFARNGDHANSAALSSERIAPLSRAVVRHYLNALRLIRGVGDGFGVATIFFWQPCLFTKQRLSDHEARYQNDGAPVPELRARFYQAVWSALKTNPEFRSMPGAIDVSGLFDDMAEPYFIDPFHLAEKGNDAVAEAMLPHVATALGRRGGKAAAGS